MYLSNKIHTIIHTTFHTHMLLNFPFLSQSLVKVPSFVFVFSIASFSKCFYDIATQSVGLFLLLYLSFIIY